MTSRPADIRVAVLSYANWQRRFAGDPSVVGKQVTINNTPITIIGVAPEGFIGSFFGVATAAWVPMAMQKEMMGGDRMNQRGNGWFQSIVRLKPGVSQEQAQAEASSIMAQLEQEYRDFNDGPPTADRADVGGAVRRRDRARADARRCCRSWSRSCS